MPIEQARTGLLRLGPGYGGFPYIEARRQGDVSKR
jgi:hypothetical protein